MTAKEVLKKFRAVTRTLHTSGVFENLMNNNLINLVRSSK